MGVYVEEEWRYKKGDHSSQKTTFKSRRSAFAHKINQKRKGNTSSGKKGSREVIIKFTEGAKSRAGIREAIKYISRKYELVLYRVLGRIVRKYTLRNASVVLRCLIMVN